jgi:hypothetical protein
MVPATVEVQEKELKHRHDVGHPDHEAKATGAITKGIQLALGLAIAGTLFLLLYLLVSMR